MKLKLLLTDDIDNSRRKGDIVEVKGGFARNFLLPKRKGVLVDKRTIRMREHLQAERAKQTKEDRSHSEKVALGIEGKVFEVQAKTDPDGNMYGSISAIDIVRLLEENGHKIDRRFVKLPAAIKRLGKHQIVLTLKEDVQAEFTLNIQGDQPLPVKKEKKAPAEPKAEEAEPSS